MAKSKRARKAQKAQQRNAKQRQAQQFHQVQQANKNKQVQELRAKYQHVVEQNKPAKSNANTAKANAAAVKAPQPSAAKAATVKNGAKKPVGTNSMATRTSVVKPVGAKPTLPEVLAAPLAPKVPTLEDWQAKQRQRTEEAYERKQEELKLKEVEFELQAEPKKHWGRKILAACAIVLAVVNLGIGGWILAQNFLPHNEIEVPHAGETIAADAEVDFNQRILAEDGADFVPVYRLGTAQNLVLKFPDLKCTDDCANVQDVMLDERFLSKDEHSVLDDEGLMIILNADFLESLEPNDYTLTFEVEENGEHKIIGVVLTIEKVELVCAEGQVLQGETCVDEAGKEVAKPVERVVKRTENTAPLNSNNNQSSNNSNSNQSNAPAEPSTPEQPAEPGKSPEQIACEKQSGPTSLVILHWLNDEEKAAHPSAEVYIERGSFGSGAAKMVWVNGTCRPAVSQSNYQGAGNYISSYRASVVYGGAVSNAITEHRGQDVVIWYWDYGQPKTELVTDARAVLGY